MFFISIISRDSTNKGHIYEEILYFWANKYTISRVVIMLNE